MEEKRPVFLAGVAQFNDGYFFEAHETWEDLWLQSPWPVRQFLQGLIQVAAAFVHLMRHEFPGTVGLMGAALQKMEAFPPDYMGMDAVRLVTEVRSAREALEALGPAQFEVWDRTGIPQIVLLREP